MAEATVAVTVVDTVVVTEVTEATEATAVVTVATVVVTVATAMATLVALVSDTTDRLSSINLIVVFNSSLPFITQNKRRNIFIGFNQFHCIQIAVLYSYPPLHPFFMSQVLDLFKIEYNRTINMFNLFMV